MSRYGVELDRVSKTYPGMRRGPTGHKAAVSDLTLSVGEGEVLGLLGPNGAGKSTALRMIAGLVTPTSGRISVAGSDVVSERRAALRNIGMVFDRGRTLYPRMTAFENVEYFGMLRRACKLSTNRARARKWLGLFGLDQWADLPVNDMSTGTRQKVSLAAALIGEPKVLLMDEPTLGLDVQSSRELMALIRRLARDDGRTILLSTHQMDVAQRICDRVCVMSDGAALATDTVDRLVNMFACRAYRITLATMAAGNVDEVLRRLEPIGDSRLASDDSNALIVEVPDEKALYEVLGVLRGSDLGIESVERQEPRLEAAFLRLTGGEGRAS